MTVVCVLATSDRFKKMEECSVEMKCVCLVARVKYAKSMRRDV